MDKPYSFADDVQEQANSCLSRLTRVQQKTMASCGADMKTYRKGFTLPTKGDLMIMINGRYPERPRSGEHRELLKDLDSQLPKSDNTDPSDKRGHNETVAERYRVCGVKPSLDCRTWMCPVTGFVFPVFNEYLGEFSEDSDDIPVQSSAGSDGVAGESPTLVNPDKASHKTGPSSLSQPFRHHVKVPDPDSSSTVIEIQPDLPFAKGYHGTDSYRLPHKRHGGPRVQPSGSSLQLPEGTGSERPRTKEHLDNGTRATSERAHQRRQVVQANPETTDLSQHAIESGKSSQGGSPEHFDIKSSGYCWHDWD